MTIYDCSKYSADGKSGNAQEHRKHILVHRPGLRRGEPKSAYQERNERGTDRRHVDNTREGEAPSEPIYGFGRSLTLPTRNRSAGCALGPVSCVDQGSLARHEGPWHTSLQVPYGGIPKRQRLPGGRRSRRRATGRAGGAGRAGRTAGSLSYCTPGAA